MGKLIVIDGLDGSGKQTQCELLCAALEQSCIDFRKIEFPTYTKSSALIEMYLQGQFGKAAEDVNAYAASVFFTVDRIASFMTDWKKDYDDGRLIICDRYTTANALHQMPKLPEREWDEYLSWLYDLEFEKIGLPRPDLVIMLDMPPEYSASLLKIRYDQDESKKDLHEKDIQYLNKCYAAAKLAADKLGFVTIPCISEGKIISKEEIAAKVSEKVMAAIG